MNETKVAGQSEISVPPPRRWPLPRIDIARARNKVSALASRPLALPRWPSVSLPRVNGRIILAALFGIGILHIVATLMAPNLAIATAFDRLTPLLSTNRMVVMPEIAPGAQPLPFLNPALRYAMCRFDTSVKPIDVFASLNDRGASLNVYSPLGETIYAYAASNELRRQRVRLVAPDDRFLGLTPESRGQIATDVPTATLPILTGVAVVAIPDRGLAYRSETDRLLQSARCTPVQ